MFIRAYGVAPCDTKKLKASKQGTGFRRLFMQRFYDPLFTGTNICL